MQTVANSVEPPLRLTTDGASDYSRTCPRMVRKLDLLESVFVRHRRGPEARDNELTRCRESWIRFGSC